MPTPVPPDSLAPPGAQHNWLPKDGWVWMHWLPFEEPELAAALGTNAAGIRSFLSSSVLGILTGEADEGVRTGSESRAQSRRMLARQRRDLGCWMATPLPKLDPTNPFGGRNGDPGAAAGVSRRPATPGCGGMDMATA